VLGCALCRAQDLFLDHEYHVGVVGIETRGLCKKGNQITGSCMCRESVVVYEIKTWIEGKSSLLKGGDWSSEARM